MPSTATITSFYSFSPNTKAKASEVNTNFSVFRGHILPVDPNTSAAAATSTYDLGASAYRFRTSYLRDIDLATSTSTAGLLLSGDSSNTTGAFLFQINSSTVAKVELDGFNPQYIANRYTYSSGIVGPTTITAGATSGLTEVNVAGLTLSLSNIRGKVSLAFFHTTLSGNTTSSTDFGQIFFSAATLGTYYDIRLYRDSTMIDRITPAFGSQTYNPSEFIFYDLSPSTNPVYQIKVATAIASANVVFRKVKLGAVL